MKNHQLMSELYLQALALSATKSGGGVVVRARFFVLFSPRLR